MKWLFLFLFSSLFAVELELGKVIVDVEVASTQESRVKGLSGRTSLPDGTGMLFVFENAHLCSFWMKDTDVPLSIGFFDKDKTLLQWTDMTPHANKENPHPIYKSQKPALYALEVPLGWFRNNQIQLGQKFRFVEK